MLEVLIGTVIALLGGTAVLFTKIRSIMKEQKKTEDELKAAQGSLKTVEKVNEIKNDIRSSGADPRDRLQSDWTRDR